MNSVAKNSLLNMFCAIVDFIFPLFTSAYIARILMADGVGRIAFVQSIVGYFASFVELGISVYGIREIAKVRTSKSNTDKVFSELVVINFLSTTCALAGLAFVIVQYESLQTELPLFFACGFSIIVNYFNISWVFEGQEEYAYIVGRNLLTKVLSLAAIFVCVNTKEDYIKYALIISLVGAGNRVLDLCRIHGRIRFFYRGLSLKKHFKPFCLLAVNALFKNLYGKVDITILGILSTRTAIGYYSYANSIIYIVITVCTSIAAVWYPRLSYCYKNERKEFNKLLQLEMKILIFISFPASVGTVVLAPQIIEFLFGDDFLAAVRTFRILSVLIVIKSISELCYQLIIVTGNEKKRIPILCLGITENILLNCLFIPKWADFGSAAALLISEITITVWLIRKMYRLLQFEIPWRVLGQTLFASFAMGIGVFLLLPGNLPSALQCGMGIAFGVCIYSIFGLLLKNELVEMVFDKVKLIIHK